MLKTVLPYCVKFDSRFVWGHEKEIIYLNCISIFECIFYFVKNTKPNRKMEPKLNKWRPTSWVSPKICLDIIAVSLQTCSRLVEDFFTTCLLTCRVIPRTVSLFILSKSATVGKGRLNYTFSFKDLLKKYSIALRSEDLAGHMMNS